MPIGPGSGFNMLVPGEYGGLAILGPDTEFPLILTTRRSEECCFLEMLGINIRLLHQHLLTLIDYESNCELVKRLPLSCIDSTNFGTTCITHIKVDEAEQVTQSSVNPNLIQKFH